MSNVKEVDGTGFGRKYPQDWNSVPALKVAAKDCVEMLLTAVEKRDRKIRELQAQLDKALGENKES